MTIALIVSLIAIAALFFMLRFVKAHHVAERNTDEIASFLQPVDVDAFRNLTDVLEDEYLRRSLPMAEFRAVQRERRLAAVEYVRCAARNAAILVRVAEAARLDADPAVAQAGERLFDNAIRLRMYAFRMVPRLYFGILFPSVTVPSGIADAYDTASRQMVMLGCLQTPRQQVSAAV